MGKGALRSILDLADQGLARFDQVQSQLQDTMGNACHGSCYMRTSSTPYRFPAKAPAGHAKNKDR